jgi:hypothetical protein
LDRLVELPCDNGGYGKRLLEAYDGQPRASALRPILSAGTP